MTGRLYHGHLSIMLLVGVLTAFLLGVYDWVFNFSRFWDFNVYIKAQQHLQATGSPYFERESLRYIYPPSANFILYLISDSQLYKAFYFILSGTLWTLTACLFVRRPFEIAIIIPTLFIAFGLQGWITVLSGNIATIMYFVAALAAWAYFTDKISTLIFVVIITLLALVKPFYAEFLIFIWFVRSFKHFIIYAFCLLAFFFAFNLVFYNELFFIFLETLKVSDYDNEIFGITLMSHLIGKGIPTLLAFAIQALLFGGLFLLFLTKYSHFSDSEKFAIIFIFAVFINPKQITYDLIVCLPALALLLLASKRWVMVTGFAIIATASLIDYGLAPKPWFQWWYAFIICFASCLMVSPFDQKLRINFWQRLFKPTHITDI